MTPLESPARPLLAGPTFARRLRAERQGHGVTLRELSARSGVSLDMLHRIEKGQRTPTLGLAERAAGALGTSLAELLSEPTTTTTTTEGDPC